MMTTVMTDSLKEILKSELNIKVNGRLWVEAAGQHFLGPGPIELLELIVKTGSLNKAAAEMKMSYKKAWMLINTLNAHTAIPVVIPQVGGERGGGSVVTDAGVELINYHRELRRRFKAFVEEETKRLLEE